ncbi:hypothetical protein QNI16_20255 [Cytophagaceae bacterium YF14B1]|uniref:Zinc-finger domain-containing protein n=1 Tax=Xanthocytophaga flava TaxID=3048013 RepID=A0AAE3QTA6_9BACT|nr:hypothetical protein [Xanthocytophaga flavus]MDJ1482845.1 hypothetical protein [Xanthocytophaga flavus]
MMTEHLSEEEIQQYALDNTACGEAVKVHVHACPHCRQKVENYQLLFMAIKAQPPATFDFDLAESVLEKLPQPRKSLGNVLVSFILGLAILGMGCLLYFFRGQLASLFSGIASLTIYLILIASLAIFGFLCIDKYMRFVKQTKKLNYY